MSAIDTVLARLDRAKQVKPNAWMAACPCCASRRGRPLSVTEGSDGRVLMHAFCGCETASVLGALGLTVTDLFPAPLEHRHEPRRPNVSARDVMAALSHEATTLAILAADMQAGRPIDQQRLATCVQRIGAARDLIR